MAFRHAVLRPLTKARTTIQSLRAPLAASVRGATTFHRHPGMAVLEEADVACVEAPANAAARAGRRTYDRRQSPT
jgi:hypothetical protein